MEKMICRPLVFLLLPSLGFAQQIWQLQNSNFPSDVVWVASLSAVNNQVCWASGQKSYDNSQPYPGYIRTTNGGNTWVCDSIPGAENGFINQIVALDANTAYAAVYVVNWSEYKGVYKTTDGGATWTKQNAYASSSMGPGYIHFFDPNNGVVIGDPDLETYTTTNGGLNWNPVTMPPALPDEYTLVGGNSIAGAGNCMWFSTTKRILRSTDRGYTWSTSDFANGACIAFQDSHTGIYSTWQASPSLSIYRKTTDGGVTWNAITDEIIESMIATCIRHVPGTTSTYLISGGWLEGRGLACTYDAGGDWTPIDTTGNYTIAFVSDSIGWGAQVFATNAVYKYIGPWITPNSVESGVTAPASYLLEQNFPNPFNPSTHIKYDLPEDVHVRLIVYDLLGREVATLVNRGQKAGWYDVQLDATQLSSGIYFFKLEAGSFAGLKRMVLLK